MRNRSAVILTSGVLCAGLVAWSRSATVQAAPGPESKSALTQGFKKGTLDFKSIGPLTFSPSGVLFFADDQGGALYGVDLREASDKKDPAYTRVPDLGTTLAARLGTTPAGIEIRDMAVSPISHNTYLSVRKTDGADQNPANPANYALFAVSPAGKVMPVDLSDKPFGRVAITGDSKKPYFGTVARIISDISYARGRVLLGVLSAEQFKSNLVSVPVPFTSTGVERFATSIYHVSHKRQETASPIETLTVYRDGDREYLMAAYVCTPVVRFNLDDLKPNATVTGVTVAELGSGNRPMEMIAYGKPGQQSLLLNNHAFGIMKVDAKIAKEAEAVNEKTTADRGNGGKKPYAGLDVVESMKGAKAFAAGTDSTLLVVKPTADGMALEPIAAP